MTSLLVSPSTPEELMLLSALLKKMNIAAKELTDEEQEDLGLSLMIAEAMKDPDASREEVMRKLGQA